MKVEILKYFEKDYEHTKAYLDVKELTRGIEIYGLRVVEGKNGNRFIGMPSKKYDKRDGTTGWWDIVRFSDRSDGDEFQKAVFAALEEHNAPDGGGQKDIPF